MSTEVVVAYLGAAAWLPQVIGWVRAWLAKPRVEIIAGNFPQVGYTVLGHIVNLPCAISSEQLDATITRMELELVHAEGQKLKLTWQTLNENFSNIRNNTSGEMAEVSKSQPAIALKVGTTLLCERLVGFQDSVFLNEISVLTNAVVEHKAYLSSVGQLNRESLTRSRPFFDLIEFYKKRYMWREGAYTATTKITVNRVKEPKVNVWTFTLSKTDIDRLNQNLDLIEGFLGNALSGTSQDQVQMQWVNPSLSEKASS